MKRLLLLVCLAAVIGSRPELRDRAVPLLRPVLDPARAILAREQAQRVAFAVSRAIAGGAPAPRTGREASALLHQLFPRDEAMAVDPWGAPFAVRVRAGSVSVVSPGPDGESGTGDDVGSSACLAPAE